MEQDRSQYWITSFSLSTSRIRIVKLFQNAQWLFSCSSDDHSIQWNVLRCVPHQHCGILFKSTVPRNTFFPVHLELNCSGHFVKETFKYSYVNARHNMDGQGFNVVRSGGLERAGTRMRYVTDQLTWRLTIMLRHYMRENFHPSAQF